MSLFVESVQRMKCPCDVGVIHYHNGPVYYSAWCTDYFLKLLRCFLGYMSSSVILVVFKHSCQVVCVYKYISPLYAYNLPLISFSDMRDDSTPAYTCRKIDFKFYCRTIQILKPKLGNFALTISPS